MNFRQNNESIVEWATHVVIYSLIYFVSVFNLLYNVFYTLGLWGVVNNAGFNIRADVELCTLDQYRAVMDVNLYGMIAVIKAFLPQIRESKGRIYVMVESFLVIGNSWYISRPLEIFF